MSDQNPPRKTILTLANFEAALGSLKKEQERTMAWTTPTICEVCVGMEVTAYESSEF